MKKSLVFLLTVCLSLCLFALTGCGGGGETENPEETANSEDFQITLTLADHLDAEHPYMKYGSVKFMQLVEERTDGRVKFTHYPSCQAGEMKDHINMMQTGIVSMADSPAAILSEQLPLSNVVNLPSWGISTDKLALAFYDLATDENSALYKSDFEANGIKMLFCGCFPNYQLQSNKPIETKDDFKNLMVRSPGGSLDLLLESLGSSVISIPPTELYEAMQRGTVDAMYSPQESLIPQALNEVMTYSTGNLDLNSFVIMWDISLDVWNTLPEDIQQIMIECGKEVTESFSKDLLTEYDKAQTELEAQGIKFTQFSDEELTKCHEAIAGVNDEWVKTIDSKGLPGTETYEAFSQIVESYK
ncbi:MAG: TRAP transporter substrate-binding protein DctP [Bacillota bacterium]|jgi:TRAP-type C4-dicarboxylate transport system substrate-binding protein